MQTLSRLDDQINKDKNLIRAQKHSIDYPILDNLNNSLTHSKMEEKDKIYESTSDKNSLAKSNEKPHIFGKSSYLCNYK